MEPHKRIIVALDTSSESQALEWARLLGPRCGAVKIGMQLYASGGPQIVRTIRDAGAEIFLDLKLHDIPTTVAKATQALMPLEPLMLNFHALGGVTMLGEAADAAKSLCEKQRLRPPILLAVTILTSHDETSIQRIGIAGPISDLVTRLALLAKNAGLDGVVASAREVTLVKHACGAQFTVVTPGIRPPSAVVDDQARTMTPAAAIAAGADYMVIGRPITHNPDPLRALEDIIAGLSAPPPVA